MENENLKGVRLKSLNNVPDFFSGSSSHWDYRYIHSPSTSQLIENNSLWVGFGGIYTGIWRLKINTPQVELIDYYQKTYTQIIVSYNDEIVKNYNSNFCYIFKYFFERS